MPLLILYLMIGDQLKIWYLPAAAGAGLLLSCISIFYFRDERHVTRVLSLCLVGFFVAIVWILTIVNEVVGVLQTIGHVFGLSDAIVGLTIFAMVSDFCVCVCVYVYRVHMLMSVYV